MCVCVESDAQSWDETVPWGLCPNMVLSLPCCLYLIGFQQCCHNEVQRSTVIAWLGGLERLSACLCLRLLLCMITEWEGKFCLVTGELNIWQRRNDGDQAAILGKGDKKESQKGTSNVRSYVVICLDEQHFSLCLYPRCGNHLCGRKLNKTRISYFIPQ